MVSGQELARWREETRKQALALSISPQEVDWLLEALTGLSSLRLYLETYQGDAEIPLRVSFSELKKRWEKRVRGRIPVQYLAGETPWRDLSVQVSPGVLIPRPETEMIVELALNYAREEFRQGHWVDLGTGSGAIALAFAKALPLAAIHAVDNSPAALAVARQNAQNLGLASNIQFHQGSWFGPLRHLQGQISVMVSNPPYVPTAALKQLQPEVAKHEPHLALDGGKDGLAAIGHLIETAPQFLRRGGLWLTEMGAGQAGTVEQLLKNNGHYCNIAIKKDLSGMERFALAEVKS
ncbi:MAG: peptide chain release factor N(5)-glutamine methyltransferase [Cyanobacteria bacterium SW_9_44_58]|nr:MAG: peptide chain release factor N(5)-glutamine methyltransferase [Cyanobacteria bacterium SW_9_44_58]